MPTFSGVSGTQTWAFCDPNACHSSSAPLAEALASDPDDFSAASDELSHLQWIRLDALRSIDMPFITEVVLAEVAARAHDERPPASVPFFRNDDEESLFLRLYGRPMQD